MATQGSRRLSPIDPDEHSYAVIAGALERYGAPEEAAAALAAGVSEIVVVRQAERADLQAQILDRWAAALDRLELLAAGCRGAGLQFERRYVPAAQAANDVRVRVLRDLWAESSLIGGEILSLLRAGYGAGALARWRALHEVTVIALFVGSSGASVAERLLEHRGMQVRRLRWAYRGWATKTGVEQLGARETFEMREEDRVLVSQYGRVFGRRYGWAHDALVAGSEQYAESLHTDEGKRRTGPNLADLERAIGFGDRLYFEIASAIAHGQPGAGDAILPEDEQGALHTSATGRDLAAAGSQASLSLVGAAGALVLSFPDPDEPDRHFAAMVALLRELARLADEAFAAVDA
jgi:hypothetical protein